MVTPAGFSERIFEFAFNAEFAARHSAVIAACPALPSLQEEKKLGYDVEFQLKRRGGGIRSVFLQHKVARLVTTKCGSNAHFYNAIGGPYFAFQLDIAQYNLIHALAKHRKRHIYYCAPLCTGRRRIDEIFMQKKVCETSLWIDIGNANEIVDTESHTIVYSQDGKRAFRFSSQPEKVETLVPGSLDDIVDRHERGFDREEAEKLYNDVHSELVKNWKPVHRRGRFLQQQSGEEHLLLSSEALRLGPPKRLPGEASRGQLIEETSELLARWYGVSWLIVGRTEPQT